MQTIRIFILITMYSESVFSQNEKQGLLKYQQITWFTDSTDLLSRPVELYFNQTESMVKDGDAQKLKIGANIVPKMNDNIRKSVYKNLSSKFMLSRENAISERLIVKDTLINIDWIYSEEIRKIGELKCKKAEADFRGRHYIAWYSLDIPVSTGPWKLHGLPGIIVEAYDTIGHVKFLFRSLTFFPKAQVNIEYPTLPTNVKPISFNEFLVKFKKNRDNQVKMMMSEDLSKMKASISEANIMFQGIEIFPNQ